MANEKKYIPTEWISEEGFFVSDDFIEYARPLVQGEVLPLIEDGLPNYVRFKKNFQIDT